MVYRLQVLTPNANSFRIKNVGQIFRHWQPNTDKHTDKCMLQLTYTTCNWCLNYVFLGTIISNQSVSWHTLRHNPSIWHEPAQKSLTPVTRVSWALFNVHNEIGPGSRHLALNCSEKQCRVTKWLSRAHAVWEGLNTMTAGLANVCCTNGCLTQIELHVRNSQFAILGKVSSRHSHLASSKHLSSYTPSVRQVDTIFHVKSHDDEGTKHSSDFCYYSSSVVSNSHHDSGIIKSE